ncbi:MAG: DUF456 domain-containing protein [Phycisphaerae bacterium]|nr:DUF456 domain-containing protein [Phycisphaerae bacterium]
MTITQIIAASLTLLLAFGGILVQLAGLPGTWLILLFAVFLRAVEALVPLGSEPVFGWPTFAILTGLALLAELVEFLAAAAGAKTGGASKRGMTGAVAGGLLGALFGTFLIPIPVVGSVIGAAAGSAIGAIAGELSVGGKELRSTMKPAAGAVAGRLLGTLAKTGFAAAMWVVMVITTVA